MHKRLNISLPEETIQLLDRVIPRGDRSKFIDRAVRGEVRRAGKTRLRQELEEGYRMRGKEDLQIAAEWDHLSSEAWAKLGLEEG